MIRYYLVLIFASFYLTTYAQEKKAPEPQRFSVGIKAGPSVTWGHLPDKAQRDLFNSLPKLGFGGGFLISFPLKDRFSYFAEVGYSQRGRKLKITDAHLDAVNNATYQFAELAMGLRRSFKLNIAPNIPSNWFINIGPNIQYWISGKGKFVESKYKIKFNVPPDGDLYTNYIQNPNRWLFGADIGIGADAPINNRQRIFVEFRATLGQTYLGKKNNASNYATIVWEDTLKTNLKTFSLTAAYTLDFDMRAMKMGKSTLNRKLKKSR